MNLVNLKAKVIGKVAIAPKPILILKLEGKFYPSILDFTCGSWSDYQRMNIGDTVTPVFIKNDDGSLTLYSEGERITREVGEVLRKNAEMWRDIYIGRGNIPPA